MHVGAFLYQTAMPNCNLFEDFLKKSLALGRTFTAKGFLKALKYLLLLCGKSGRGFDNYREDEVTDALWVVDVGDTLAPEGKGRAGLCSVGEIELFGSTTKKGYVDGRTERSLYKGDRDLAINIVAVTCEYVVRLYLYLDDKVSAWATVSSDRTLSAKNDSLHIINTCGDGNVKLFVDLYIAFSVAIFTRGLYNLTRSATRGAGSL